MKRVLVTGSREWADAAYVREALDHVAAVMGPFILVQGDSPKGLDAIAKQWAIETGIEHEDVPADWSRACGADCHHQPRWRGGEPYCPMAGHLRNQEMIDRGAEVVLAFPLGRSPGTRDAMRRAKRAGIDVIDMTKPGGKQ